MSETYDLIVIGGGSGGIATARRAAKHGAKAVVIEAGRLGGTCVNVGCVPKKVMWNAAEMVRYLRDAPGYGFDVGETRHDWAALRARREAYIERLNGIYGSNLDRDGVELIRGQAVFEDERSVRVGERRLSAPHIVIATGGFPAWPELPGAALGTDSDGFFMLDECPASVALVGSGYIAVELAGILNALGAKTTLLLRKAHVLKAFDAMLGESLIEHMRAAGIRVEQNVQVAELEEAGNGVNVRYQDGGVETFDTLVWAIGRTPNTHLLGLDAVGVDQDITGHIEVDDYQNTTVPGIYAVGDVTGRVELTPVAIAAGRRLADRVFGGAIDRHLDYNNIPSVVFTHPPIGTVGLSEGDARARFGDEAVRIYENRFVDLYYGVLDEKVGSHMKLVCTGEDERIVGAHVIGESADEMIQGFAVAVRMGARKRDFDDTVAIHPTSAEEFVTMT